jgi:glycine/D-amino acid oxidase-like deaminating enzyme
LKTRADIVVIGGGVIGCATAYNLARHGAKNVVVLEKGALCSGGTSKSCAIIRTHYSIQANLQHAVESLKIFSHFAEIIGGDCGWNRTGYLILGPAEHRAPMEAVFRLQNEYGIDTRLMSKAEALEVHPLLYLDDVEVIGYDTQAGYANPLLTTASYAQRAQELGVAIQPHSPVTGLTVNGTTFTIETPQASFEAEQVILAAGPWTNTLAEMIDLQFPYENSRHKVITLKIDRPYRNDWPIVKDLMTPDKIYFRPTAEGTLLLGTGDYGYPLGEGPLITDQVDEDHLARMDALISHRVPSFARRDYVAGWTAPYDITSDWNPIVGPVPEVEGLYVGVGFSGHGFKLAPTLSEGLAQAVLGLEPRVPIDMYRLSRFTEGQVLHGAYGLGSIS